MKLKTELHEGKLGFFDINTVYHDAAYAHALVQALDEKADNHEYFRQGSGYGVDLILHRASDIMREWGYP